MTLQYMLLYFQMENLFIKAKIQVSNRARQTNKMSLQKAIFLLKAALWIFVGTYILVQGALILGVLFFRLDPMIYQLQIIIVTGLLIIFLNISMLVLYCKYAGLPYISPTHYRNVVHVSLVALYWTFAFLVKLASSPFETREAPEGSGGMDSATMDQARDENERPGSSSLASSITFFALQLICDVISYLIIVESSFVEAFLGRIVETKPEHEDENENVLTDRATEAKFENIEWPDKADDPNEIRFSPTHSSL